MKYAFFAIALFAIGYTLPAITFSLNLVLTIGLVLVLFTFFMYYMDTRFPTRYKQ